MAKYVALYLRVSSDVQETERQVTLLNDQIASENEKDEVIVYKIYKDKISGLKDEKNRPDLNELLQLTKEQIQAVYVTEVSRLSRNPDYLITVVKRFKEKGINVFFLSEKLNTINEDPKYDMFTDIVIAMYAHTSSHELKLKNDRARSGKREAIVKKGNSHAYKPAYGYRVINKKLEIDPSEAPYIKEIFTRYANGERARDIVVYMNLIGAHPRNYGYIKKDKFKVSEGMHIERAKLKWAKSTIKVILKNPVYYGYFKMKTGDIIHPPAIISEELFQKCQSEIKKRVFNTDKTRKNEFLLRGILRCGNCGKFYNGCRSHKTLIYKCSDKTHIFTNSYLGCKNTSIDQTHLENMTWASIKGAYHNFKNDQLKAENIGKFEKSISDYEVQLTSIERKFIELQVEEDRLVNLYVTGRVSLSNYENETERIESETISLKKEKEKLIELKNEVSHSLTSLLTIDSKPFDLHEIDHNYLLKKAAVKELVREILIYRIDKYFTVFTINFKAGYFVYLIRRTLKRKYQYVDGNGCKFDDQNKTFSIESYKGTIDNIMDLTPTTINLTPEQLYFQLEKDENYRNSDEFKKLVEEYESEQERLKDAAGI